MMMLMLGVVLLIFYVIVLAFCSMSRCVTVAFVVWHMCWLQDQRWSKIKLKKKPLN